MTAIAEPALLELLHGKGAHADPLKCVEDLSAELAGRQVAGLPYSIWQQLAHMNYWMDYELRRIRGQRPPYPKHAAESWPAHAAPSEGEWREAIEQFKRLIEDYAALGRSSPEELRREIEPMHKVDTQNSSTLSAVLWQMVTHNSYHTGQIVMLRRALGAWPPPTGGDTW